MIDCNRQSDLFVRFLGGKEDDTWRCELDCHVAVDRTDSPRKFFRTDGVNDSDHYIAYDI